MKLYMGTVSCIGTVIQNYFKVSNVSYTPSIILYDFIHNLRIIASETRHMLLENRAWRVLSRPPGKYSIVDARVIAS